MTAYLENPRDSTGNQLELMILMLTHKRLTHKVTTKKLCFFHNCVEIRKRIGNDRFTRAIKIYSQVILMKNMGTI